MKSFKTWDVCVEAAVQKGEERGIRKGQRQSCQGDHESLLRARHALCHLWEWEEVGRASRGGLDTLGDTMNTTCNPHPAGVVSGIPPKNMLWGVLEMGPTRPTVCVVRRQGQSPRNATGRGVAWSSHLGQHRCFLAWGRSKRREYHHTPAHAPEIWGLNSSQLGKGKSLNQSRAPQEGYLATGPWEQGEVDHHHLPLPAAFHAGLGIVRARALGPCVLRGPGGRLVRSHLSSCQQQFSWGI